MKKSTKLFAIAIAAILVPLAASADQSSWGDTQGSGCRESASTGTFSPGRFAFDGNADTAWQLSAGSSSGWVEAYAASPSRYAGAAINATIPSGARLSLSVLSNGNYIAIPGGAVFGPMSGTQRLVFPGELPPTARIKAELSGDSADQAKVYEISLEQSAAPTPYGKIVPKSYTTNFAEYINIKASRLWNGINSSDWFEPLWSLPSEPFQTDSASKPTAIFPPYLGNPPVSVGQIVWQLDGTYDIQTLKVYQINSGRWVRFEFWVNGKWASAQDISNRWTTGWQRLQLASPVRTSQIRISFPGGWEQARYIGQIQVWGQGWSDAPSRPLALAPAGSDGYQQFSLDDVEQRNYRLSAVLPGAPAASLAGEWNGGAISLSPAASMSGETLYQAQLPAASIMAGQQYLKLATGGGAAGVSLDSGEDKGLIDLGSPWCNGYFDQGASAAENPKLASKIWSLGGGYQLERLRVYMKGTATPQFQAEYKGAKSAVLWTSSGSGWWEASLGGALADALDFSAATAVAIDQIQLYGTPLSDGKVDIELWWPKDSASNPVSSNGTDGNSIIGWMGDPSVQPTINGYHPRQSDKLFWMPLGQMGMSLGGQYSLSVSGVLGAASSQFGSILCWWKGSQATLSQGTALASTSQDSIALSGTDSILGSTCFIGGKEVPVAGGKYGYSAPLAYGYQIVPVEIRAADKKTILMSWRKPVYRSLGDPVIAFDLPPGDLWTQNGTLQLSGRVGNGPGLSLALNGTALPLSGDSYQSSAALKEGPQTLVFTLTDSLGRKTTRTLSLGKDITPPSIAIASPLSGQYLTKPKVDLIVSGSDDQLWWSFNGGDWEAGTSNPEVKTYTLADGFYAYKVQARDRAGNQSQTASVSFFVDTTPPAAFAISSNVSGWTSNNRPTISFSTSDATSGIDHYACSIDGGELAPVASPCQLPALADGAHTVYVVAYDKAGLSTLETASFQIDTTPPSAVQTLLAVPGSNQIKVSWSAIASDTSGIASYYVTRDPAWADGTHGTTGTSFIDSGLNNGDTYSYTVWAVDKAQNTGQSATSSLAIVGLALAPVSETQPTVVQYKDMSVVIPTEDLPSGTVAVMVQTVASPTLQNISNYPIVSPIYSITTLATAEDGHLQETSHTELQKEVVVMLDYDPAQLPNGFPEANLGVYYFDTTWSKWFKVEKSAVDVDQKKIIFLTNHFTDFSVQPTMLNDLTPQQLKDIGHSPMKTESSTGAVTVSPQGGTAMTEVTDFVLQGKNGFTLPIKRMYDTGTAIADSPSLSLNASLDINDLTSILAVVKIAAQLANEGISGMENAIISKIKNALQGNGDYALATGVGWRLNFPYVMTTNTSVALRLPSGGYYNINQMRSNNSFWTSNPVKRTLDFEFHEGDDFHFRVAQVRSDITDVICSMASGSASKAIGSSLSSSGSSPGAAAYISMAASLIPGWTTVYSELWTKDGTYYYFDGGGRIRIIKDKTGLNTFTFHYDGVLLQDITDDLGRKVLFQYNSSGLGADFARPVITRIWTSGFQSHDSAVAQGSGGDPARSVSFDYDWDSTSSVGIFFNFLPTLTSTTDPEGRVNSYSYKQRTIVTGGGAIKINFLALLLDCIPGVGSFVADMLGVSALTLSGHIEINLPYTLSRVEAPGIGVTEIDSSPKDLSEFNIKMTDYFLGLFPTAMRISYDIIFRLETDSVTFTCSNGTTRTTNYSYRWSSAGDNQYYVSRATVDDGRLTVVHYFDDYEVTRYRFISWDDYLVAVAEQLFQEQSYAVDELFTLESGYTSTSDTTGRVVETVNNSWDTKHHRITAITTIRGNHSAYQGFQYDSWGNQVYALDTRTANGSEQRTETWKWYINSGSTAPGVWSYPAVDADDPLASDDTRDLLKGCVTRNYRPSEAGGGYDDVVQGYAYNAYGLKKAEGLWLGNHWATTGYSYYTDPSKESSGSMQSMTGPVAGQKTSWNYDYSRKGDFYAVTKTTLNVADPTGASSSIVQETAYDWNTAWKVFDKDPRGFVTEYAYDRLGRTTAIVAPGEEAPLSPGNWAISHASAPITTIGYSDAPAVSTATVYKGSCPSGTLKAYEKYSYDNMGQLFRIDKYNSLAAGSGGVSDTGQLSTSTTRASYDVWGDVISMTDPDGNATLYDYDYKGRLIHTTHPDSTAVSISYDDWQNIRTTTDERGLVAQEWLSWSDKTLKKVEDIVFLKLTTLTYYDGLDRVVAVTDAEGQTTITYFNPFGKQSKLMRPALDVWESPEQAQSPLADAFPVKSVAPLDLYEYDDAGRLTGQASGYQGNMRETVQVFDGAGRVVKKILGAGNPDAREEWNWYDPAGNLIKRADPFLVGQLKSGQVDPSGTEGFYLKAYSSRGKVIAETDPRGAQVRYRYDILDRKIQMKDPRSTAEATDDFTLNYYYDDLDRLILADLPPVAGLARGIETIAYDLRGNAISVVDPLGRTTAWTYDSRNRKTSQKVSGTDGTGPLCSAWGYDEAGNNTVEITASSINASAPAQSPGLATNKLYDRRNRLAETDFPDGRKIKTSYDGLDRPVAIEDAIGDRTLNAYNSLNKVIQTTDARGTITSTLYDVWGEATAARAANPIGGDQIWARHYNPFGQIVYEQNNSGQTWSYSYDPRGLVIGAIDPSGTEAANTYSPTGQLTNKVLENGSRRLAQSWSYDIAGSLMQATDGGVATSVNQRGGVYTPDPYDLIDYYSTSIGDKSLAASYTYGNGHKVRSIGYPDGAVIAYEYNGLDELTSIPGFAENGHYNYMGRLTSLSAENGTARVKAWNETEGTLDGYDWKISGKGPRELGWDSRGNLASQTRDGAASQYVYDELGRITYASEGIDCESQTDSTMPMGSKVRDVAGRLALDFQDPGAPFKLDFNASSVGVDLGSSLEISKLRLVGKSERINPRTVEAYLSQDGSDGSWTRVEDTAWLPDETGVTLQFSKTHQARFAKLHVTWDERGSMNEAIDSHSIAGPIGQLVQVWYICQGQTTSWTYDTLGNRIFESKTRANNVQTNYEYYPNTSRAKRAGAWAFNYDANGNLTSRGNAGIWDSAAGRYDWPENSGELYEYGYDLKNRLVEVRHGLAGSASLQVAAQYTYDIRDLRVQTVKAGLTTYTQYDTAGNILWHEDGTTQTKYIEALGQTWAEVRTSASGSQTYYHALDHEGSTNVITDSSGNIVWDGDYEAFGSVVRSNGTMGFTPSYTGKEYDVDTGLYYFNARWYDPTLGRFITEDPARDGGNWYEYCRDNPLTNVDPSGLGPLDFDSPGWRPTSEKINSDGLKWYTNKKTNEFINNETGIRKFADRIHHAFDHNWTPGPVQWQMDNPKAAAATTGMTPQQVAENDRNIAWIGVFDTAVGVAGAAAGGAMMARDVAAGEGIGTGIVNRGGRFADLDADRDVGEVGHHMPQNAFNRTIDRSRADGPALGMTTEDHALTRSFGGNGNRTMRDDAGLSARDRMAGEIRDVRSLFGDTYNQGIREMMNYAKTLPEYARTPK